MSKPDLPTKKMMLCGILKDFFILNSYQPTELLQVKCFGHNWKSLTELWEKANPHWSIERMEFFSMTTHNRILQEPQQKNYASWDGKFFLNLPTLLILPLPLIICFIPYETFMLWKISNEECVKNAQTEFFLSKSSEIYIRRINMLPKCWVKMIENNGNYIVDWIFFYLNKTF